MHGVGPVQLGWTLGVAVFSIAPRVLALLAEKWLYETKKSLAEISASLNEVKAQIAAGKRSMENEHE